MEALRNFWSQRAPRERLILGAAGAVLLCAAIFLLLIEPAAVGIPRLQRGLPAMRTQAEQLDRLLAEVNSLKAKPQAAVLPAAEAREALERSLAAAGLKASRIVPVGEGALQITFADVPYAAWSTWLAGAERELGAKASVVMTRATGTPGAADIEVSLRLARR
ncbi:MAG: type II secretion system protein M [Burkholderiales bacterium]|jgi:general secretion pathway protein M|nr:MAG: type II secretion system protein M [Burkholderiales bacterium]